MRDTEPTTVQWLCTCCFVLLVNGDGCQCCDQDDLLKLFGDMEVTPGMLAEHHAEGCDPTADDYEECDCETDPFSMSSCDGCGSNLGGARYAATGWIPKTANT